MLCSFCGLGIARGLPEHLLYSLRPLAKHRQQLERHAEQPHDLILCAGCLLALDPTREVQHEALGIRHPIGCAMASDAKSAEHTAHSVVLKAVIQQIVSRVGGAL